MISNELLLMSNKKPWKNVVKFNVHEINMKYDLFWIAIYVRGLI
jgi:hypothetical protein